MTRDEREREALRLYDRFVLEVVERFSICPYARGAREAGKVRRAVILDADAQKAALLAIDPWIEDDEVEVAMLIFPDAAPQSRDFDQFVADLRVVEDARRGGRSPFVMAAFHPRGEYSTATPARMTNFFRRSPDPTVQLVRLSVLEQVRGVNAGATKMVTDLSAENLARLMTTPPPTSVSERIAIENHRRAMAGAQSEIESIYEDIDKERDKSR